METLARAVGISRSCAFDAATRGRAAKHAPESPA
jgi:hypothetical protein